MAKLDEKKAFHALRKIYTAAHKLYQKGKGVPAQYGDYGFSWQEPSFETGPKKQVPIQWSFEISCRIKGQSLWDGHIEEYHLHDVIAAQYKNDNDDEKYRWLQWDTRFSKDEHEYYLDELLAWATDVIDNK